MDKTTVDYRTFAETNMLFPYAMSKNISAKYQFNIATLRHEFSFFLIGIDKSFTLSYSVSEFHMFMKDGVNGFYHIVEERIKEECIKHYLG